MSNATNHNDKDTMMFGLLQRWAERPKRPRAKRMWATLFTRSTRSPVARPPGALSLAHDLQIGVIRLESDQNGADVDAVQDHGLSVRPLVVGKKRGIATNRSATVLR